MIFAVDGLYDIKTTNVTEDFLYLKDLCLSHASVLSSQLEGADTSAGSDCAAVVGLSLQRRAAALRSSAELLRALAPVIEPLFGALQSYSLHVTGHRDLAVYNKKTEFQMLTHSALYFEALEKINNNIEEFLVFENNLADIYKHKCRGELPSLFYMSANQNKVASIVLAPAIVTKV